MLDRRGFLKALLLALPKLPFGLKSAIGPVIRAGVDDASKSPLTEREQLYADDVGKLPLSELERKQAYLDWILAQPVEHIAESPIDKLFCEFVAERNRVACQLRESLRSYAQDDVGKYVCPDVVCDETLLEGLRALDDSDSLIGYSRHKFGDGEWTKWKPFYRDR